MDRVLVLGVVDEADNGLCSFWYHEGWSRGHAIIPNQGCWPKVWVDGLCKGLELNLVVPDIVARDWILDNSALACQFSLNSTVKSVPSKRRRLT